MIDKTKFQYPLFIICALSILPTLAVFAPRALSFVPAALGLLSFGLYRVSYAKWPELNKKAVFILSAILALAAVSSLWAIDKTFALERAGKLCAVFLGGGLLISVASSLELSNVKKISKYLPIAVLFGMVLCGVEIYSRGELYMLLHPDIESFNPAFLNRATVFCVLCFWPAIYIARTFAGNLKYVQYALWIAIAAILIKADSQSSQLAFILGAAFYFLFPAGRKWAWWGFAIALIAGMIAAPWIASALFEQAAPHAQDWSWLRRSFAANRMEIWDFIARRALEKPLMGHGIEATRLIENFDTQMLYHPESTILHPHNFALQIWIEFGAMGIATFAAISIFILNAVSKLQTSAARLSMAVFISVLSVSATGYGIWQGWWVGATIAISAIAIIAMKLSERT